MPTDESCAPRLSLSNEKKAPRTAGGSRRSRSVRSGRRRGLGRHRVDADLEARLALVLELHHAVDERVDRVVGAETDVLARVPPRAALTHDDVARHDPLSAELLDAAVFRVAVAAVARRADAFFMSHFILASAESDVVDADFGEALPVTLLLRVILPALHLEDDDLVGETVLDDLAGDLGTRQGRDARLHGLAIAAKQNVVELDRPAGLAHERGEAIFLARLDAELLAAGANDCVRHM